MAMKSNASQTKPEAEYIVLPASVVSHFHNGNNKFIIFINKHNNTVLIVFLMIHSPKLDTLTICTELFLSLATSSRIFYSDSVREGYYM